ncbi:hypothetical protein L6452_27126 [Arctium lappa]|uniref:Uncharacterized protein n=1 Tax=Arctium lappa TaxID=4217 RepID=A0ACB8ZWQ6_ARCLA|nr:hypothetical protein L6452_27126 [Arctium lappa]
MDPCYNADDNQRRPWKERKRANKEREKGSLQPIPHDQDPELIYYGQYSEVVGPSKSELFQDVSSHDISQHGYDKVLVDEECTHDGSIKHIQKFENWGWTTLERRFLDAERTDDLTVLQFRLLTNGFKLLKVGTLFTALAALGANSYSQSVIGSLLSEKKREIGTLKILKHPNVVRLHEVLASKTKIYMILEYVNGGELFDAIISKQATNQLSFCL